MVRRKLDNLFSRSATFFYDHKIKVICFTLVVIAVLGFQLQNLKMDTSTESFFNKGDTSLIEYNQFRDLFGRDDTLVIGIKTPNLFDQEVLNDIKKLHDEISESVPYLDEVTSIFNIRHVRGDDDSLIVEDLLEEVPQTEMQMIEFKKKILSTPLYENMVISKDRTLTTILIKIETYLGEDEFVAESFESFDKKTSDSRDSRLLTDKHTATIIDRLKNIINKYEKDGFKIHMAGSPAVDDAVKRIIALDMGKFTGLSFLVIIVFLYIMFRRVSGITIPLLVAILTMVSVLGLMGWFSFSLNVVNQILSSFLLVVSVGYSIHIIVFFYQKFGETKNKRDAIAHAMGHAGLPVALTSLTTIGGLISFSFADIAPVAEFGIIGAIGVLIAFIYCVVLIPVFIGLFPIKVKQEVEHKSSSFDRLLKGIGDVSLNHRNKIVFISVIFIGISLYGITKLKFSHNILDWLPDTLPSKQATNIIDEELNGSVSVEVILKGKAKNDFYYPELLRKMDQAKLDIEEKTFGQLRPGKVLSVTDMLKESNKALHENKDAFYSIPDNRELVAQEFFLFESSGSDDLEDYVNSTFQTGRISIMTPFTNAVHYIKFLAFLDDYFDTNFADMDVTITGLIALFTKTFHNLITSMSKSYIVAFIVISCLMFVFIGNFKIALLCLVPNLTPILILMGFMGLAGINLDSANILIGSIAMGLIVDDTIHYMYNYVRYYDETGNTQMAIQMTLKTTGRAILTTSVVLSCGFLIYLFSSMKNIANFGLLSAGVVMLALIADFFITSAILSYLKSKKQIVPQESAPQGVQL